MKKYEFRTNTYKRRLQKAREDTPPRRSSRSLWNRAGTLDLRAASLWVPQISLSFGRWPPTAFEVQSKSSIKVGLIRRPRCILGAYISKAPGPGRKANSLFILHCGDVEASLVRMISHLQRIRARLSSVVDQFQLRVRESGAALRFWRSFQGFGMSLYLLFARLML